MLSCSNVKQRWTSSGLMDDVDINETLRVDSKVDIAVWLCAAPG